jgi:hypothetical protein
MSPLPHLEEKKERCVFHKPWRAIKALVNVNPFEHLGGVS